MTSSERFLVCLSTTDRVLHQSTKGIQHLVNGFLLEHLYQIRKETCISSKVQSFAGRARSERARPAAGGGRPASWEPGSPGGRQNGALLALAANTLSSFLLQLLPAPVF